MPVNDPYSEKKVDKSKLLLEDDYSSVNLNQGYYSNSDRMDSHSRMIDKQNDAKVQKWKQDNEKFESERLDFKNDQKEVWHFHPVAFVEQMRMIGGGDIIKKGDIIREINIRLAGFGGNVPSDIFSDRTEAIVKQFQRDYMNVDPTGEIGGNELAAIDDFSKEYDVSDEFWKQLECSCSTKGQNAKSRLRGKNELNNCKGFGDQTGKGKYRAGKSKLEPYYIYEYPGMHRSLLFALKALQFYLSKQDLYKLDHVSSGYRCRFKNYMSTNHQGKSIDLQFSKGDWHIRQAHSKNLAPLREIRDNFYIKYLGSYEKWKIPNMFSTEPIDLLYRNGSPRYDHTYSWIHMDVRTFKSRYLKDHFFCKDRSSLNGQPIASMSREVQKNVYKWAHSVFADMIAEQESNNNYNVCNKTKGGLRVVRGVNVVGTSIKDIQAKQKSRDLFAVGRYQLIPKTLKGAIDSLDLDVNQNLDEQTQDRIFQEYLITIKRPQIIKYLENGGSIRDAMYSAAKEWACIGVEKGKKISKDRIAQGDESYYAGDGLNKAHITSDEFKNALIESKK